MMSAPAILFCVITAYFIGWVVMCRQFLRMLRTRHEQTWIALGKPSLILNNSISNSIAVTRFVWRREYMELEDEWLTRFGGFMLLYQIGWLILLVLLLFIGPVGHV
jgi:hypothetical protein